MADGGLVLRSLRESDFEVSMTSLVGGFFDPCIDYFMRAEIRRQHEVR